MNSCYIKIARLLYLRCLHRRKKVIFWAVLLLLGWTFPTQSISDSSYVEVYSIAPLGGGYESDSGIAKLAALTRQDKIELERTISDIHDAVRDAHPLQVSRPLAEVGVVLSLLSPYICQEINGNRLEPRLLDDFSSVVNNGYGVDKGAVDIYRKSLFEKKQIELPAQIIVSLYFWKSICEMFGGGEGKKSDLSLASALAQIGISEEEYERLVTEYNREYNAYGYIEREDDQIYDIDKNYNENKYFLKSYEFARSRLPFSPKGYIDEPGFEFLGADNTGVVSKQGATGIVSIYDIKYGKVSVEEVFVDGVSSKTFVNSNAYNVKIGKQNAVLSVSKGRDSGRFISSIFWRDAQSSIEYSVQINLNLNDESQKKARQFIFEKLVKVFGL